MIHTLLLLVVQDVLHMTTLHFLIFEYSIRTCRCENSPVSRTAISGEAKMVKKNNQTNNLFILVPTLAKIGSNGGDVSMSG